MTLRRGRDCVTRARYGLRLPQLRYGLNCGSSRRRLRLRLHFRGDCCRGGGERPVRAQGRVARDQARHARGHGRGGRVDGGDGLPPRRCHLSHHDRSCRARGMPIDHHAAAAPPVCKGPRVPIEWRRHGRPRLGLCHGGIWLGSALCIGLVHSSSPPTLVSTWYDLAAFMASQSVLSGPSSVSRAAEGRGRYSGTIRTRRPERICVCFLQREPATIAHGAVG